MILGVPGIRDDGHRTVGAIGDELAAPFHLVRYRTPRSVLLSALSMRLPPIRRRMVAPLLAAAAGPMPCHVIAYSNGAWIVRQAMLSGATFGVVVLFGAAVDRDALWPPWAYERVYNVVHPGDRALNLARALIAHPWGALGKDGYTYAPRDDKWHEISARLIGGLRGHDYFGDRAVLSSFIDACAQWLGVPRIKKKAGD